MSSSDRSAVCPSCGRSQLHERLDGALVYVPCSARDCDRGWARSIALDRDVLDLALGQLRADPRRFCQMGTLTAPGRRVEKVSQARVALRRIPYSSADPSLVNPAAASLWESEMPRNFALLRDAAMTATARRFGEGSIQIAFRVQEPQRRGIHHIHLVVTWNTAAGFSASQFFMAYMRRHCTEYGFGRKFAASKPRAAAGFEYLRKYLSPRESVKHSVLPLRRRHARYGPKITYVRGVIWHDNGGVRKVLTVTRTIGFVSLVVISPWLQRAAPATREFARLNRRYGRRLKADTIRRLYLSILELRSLQADRLSSWVWAALDEFRSGHGPPRVTVPIASSVQLRFW